MRYYLLQKPDWFTGGIDIIRLHQRLDYRWFSQEQMHRLPSMTTLWIRHKEETEYSAILLEPLPLLNDTAWSVLQLFMKKPPHMHLILRDEKTRDIFHYFCPDLRRIKGRVDLSGKTGDREEARCYLEDALPEGLPIMYLKDGDRIQVVMGVDMLESLMRRGLCDIKLIPIVIMEGEKDGRYEG